MLKNIAVIFLFCGCLFTAKGQQDSLTQKLPASGFCEVRLTDESVYRGYFLSQNDSVLILKTQAGVLIQIPKDKIQQVELIKRKRATDTSVVTEATLGSRYYVLSSAALPFKKESVFLSSSYLVFYNVNYAVSRNFAFGISTSIIGSPIAVHAKANFELGHHMHLGFEAGAGSLMYLGPKTYGTGGALKLTFGAQKKHYTFFAGFADVEFWVASRSGRGGRPAKHANYYQRYTSPFAGAAAALPLSGRLSLTAEAFAFPNVSIYTGSFAIRTVARKSLSLVFGIQILGNTSTSVNKAFSFPYFGFCLSF